tara:strand:- start:302 stop:664 length:363 start_codon:yes stop_codon:yes gene_type:complete
VFLISIFHEFFIKFQLVDSADINYFWQNGYAGKLALSWIETSTYPVIYLVGIIGIFILTFLRMINVLSPLPFLSGFFSILYNMLSFLAGRISYPKAAEVSYSRQFTDFKNNVHIEESPSS